MFELVQLRARGHEPMTSGHHQVGHPDAPDWVLPYDGHVTTLDPYDGVVFTSPPFPVLVRN